MKKRIFAAFLAALLTFCGIPVFAAPSFAETTVTVTVVGTMRYDYAKEVFDLVNQNRRENDKKDLNHSEKLTELAMQRASECALSYGHMRPNGQSCFTVDEDGVYTCGYVNAENIAAGYRSPDAVMAGWMDSAGHRANILNEDSGSLGVGVCESAGMLYWVHLFGTGKDPVAPTLQGSVERAVPVETTLDKLGQPEFDAVSVKIGESRALPDFTCVNSEWEYGAYTLRPSYLPGAVTDAVSGKTIAEISQNATLTALESGSGKIYCRVYAEQSEPTPVTLRVKTADGKLPVYSLAGFQSDHPYGNNADDSYVYTVPGASSLQVRFSEDTAVEQDWDFIYILNGKGKQLGKYTGTELAGKTVGIEGDTVTVRLTSDDAYGTYGFRVVSVTPVYDRRHYDLNYDGTVDIIDVTALLNRLSGNASFGAADMTGDGAIDVNDVTALLNVLALAS